MCSDVFLTMRDVKLSIKILLSVALVLLIGLAGLIYLISRRNHIIGPSSSDPSGAPSFAVNVERPRMDRPFAGILPSGLEGYLFGELRFDHASRGAKVGRVDPNHIELNAEGWDLLIETDGEGRVTPETRLLFPIEIANVQWTLRCRPASPAVGYLNATKRPSASELKTSAESKTSEVLDGRLLIELARCEDAKTGKTLDTEAGGNPGDAWPSSPLTLRGSFAGLPLK
jgi:hypothetical protein